MPGTLRTARSFAARMLAPALLGSAFMAVAAAAEPPAIGLRTGDHPGFGRVVFDLPAGTTAETEQAGDRLIVHFNPAGVIRAGAGPPHNVRGIATAAGRAELALPAGAQIHLMRMDGKLVIDVLDPPTHATPIPATPAQATPAPTTPVQATPAPATPVQATPAQAAPVPATLVPATRVQAPPDRPAPVAQQHAAAPAARAPAVAPSRPVDRHDDPTPLAAAAAPMTPAPSATFDAEALPALPVGWAPSAIDPAPMLAGGDITAQPPIAVAATATRLPSGAPEHGVTLPFGVAVGAAAFRRGGMALVVFDQRRPIDMAALHADPVFAGGTIQLLPAATVLRLPLPPHNAVRLQRAASGWTVIVLPWAPTRPTPRCGRSGRSPPTV